MQDSWRVKLPVGVRPPFEVYVNGVLQHEGDDYRHREGELRFDRPLAKEGKLGFWRWFMGAWGIGTYRKNDSVDVSYQLQGRAQVAHGLEIEPPRSESTREASSGSAPPRSASTREASSGSAPPRSASTREASSGWAPPRRRR